MKTLKTKRVFAYAIMGALNNVPPSLYPSTDEIKTTINDIIPALTTVCTEYVRMNGVAMDIQKQIKRNKLDKEEGQKQLDVVKEEWDAYQEASGEEVVDIELTQGAFTVLSDQFNRTDAQNPRLWGRNWLGNIT